MFPQGWAMADGDQGNTDLFEVFVHVLFHVKSNLTSAFVQNSISWSMVNESAHSDALFFTSR